MNIRRIDSEYRLSTWAQIIQEQKESGKSVDVFCIENGINKNTYYYWYKKVKAATCTDMIQALPDIQTGSVQWIKLNTEPKNDGFLTVEINGCNIKVNNGTDTGLLIKACKALRPAL